MKLFLKTILLPLLFLVSGRQASIAQTDKNSQSDPVLMKKIADSISKDPDNIGLHERYLEATGFGKYGAKDDPAFVEQYKKWMKQYPKSAILPFALGNAYWSKESPAAKPYLLKALELNPKMDKAYFELWIDADRWGKFKEGFEYLRKAKEIAPEDPDYAFYYALSFDDDPARREALVLDMVKKFPNSDRTKTAISIVALASKNFDTRVKFYELLKEKYPLTSIGDYMKESFYDLVLMPQTKKAASLAKEVLDGSKDEKSKAMWAKQLNWALNIEKAKELMQAGQYGDAIKILDTIQLNKRMDAKQDFLILKAQAYKENNRLNDAYDMLLNYYAVNPSDKIKEQVYAYGALLNKNKNEVSNETWTILDKAAQKATSFSLNRYPANSKMSLDDLKGQVVLLTYWFPGCGPCRGEFPHFQNVVDQFKGKNLEYIGINIEASQNDYVIPFMQHSGYTFVPLEDFKGRERGNMGYIGAPTNYLLDKDGRIIYKNFRTDEHNEDVLKNMIEIVMAHS